MEGAATYVLLFGGLGVSLALPSGICALSSLPNPVIATVKPYSGLSPEARDSYTTNEGVRSMGLVKNSMGFLALCWLSS